MAAIVYPAFVTGDKERGYTARFPDLPEATTAADTQTALLSTARDVLRRQLEKLTAEDVDWPEPSELSTLSSHPDAVGATAVLVDVEVEDAPVRVNISIGERLLKRIDSAAEARGMTRSGFIASAARQSLGDPAFSGWDSKKMQDAFADASKSLTEKFGPGSDFYRGFNELDRKITKSAESWAEQIAAALRNKTPPPVDPKPTPAAEDDPTRQV